MTFTEKKHDLLRPKRELKAATFFTAMLVACAFFVPYIISGKGYFIFFGDFNVQQIPFYKMCHAAIKGGNINWSFTTDLGANFIGSYSFYLLGSPFFWITLLFKNSLVPYLMGPLLILKFSCAALTAYLYIRRFVRTPRAAMLGGLLYAFSGFSVYNIFFNHFHEAIIVFPLLLLALEKLITENRRGLFAIAVCFAAVTNYFFFFGMVVFCIIYYFVRVGMKAVKFRIGSLISIAVESVLGVLMAAALLLPSVLAVMGNGRISEILLGWNAFMYGKEQIYLNIVECFFFPPDLPARPVFFPGADVKWSSLGGWLPLFGMTGVIAWFYAKKKNWIKRLLVILAVMSMVPILNSAFYAFNAAYYARWFYMPILIMSMATVKLCEDEKADLVPGIKVAGIITLLFTVIIGLFPRKNAEGKIVLGLFVDSDTREYFYRFWGTAAIAVGSVILLAFLYHFTKENRKTFIKIGIALVCVVTVCFANFFVLLGRTHSYEIKDIMIDSLIEGELELGGDRDTYRIDTYDCVDNTAMYLGYSSINAFHSIVPSSVMEFYNYLGITRDVASRPDNTYPALRPLLSVKYLLNRKGAKSFVNDSGDNIMPGYEYVKTADNHYVYENKNFVGYGFSYDYAMNREFLDNYDGNAKARLMLKAILLDDEQKQKYGNMFTDISLLGKEKIDSPADDFDKEAYESQLESAAQENGQTEESSSAESVDESAEQSSGETENAESGENSENGESSENAENTESTESTPAAPADTSEEAEKLKIDLTDEQMAIDCALLNKTAATSFTTDKNGFTAKVTRDKKTLVFFSIPYDEGWTATVNGKKAEIEKVNVGFMAVVVDAGDSTVRFDYKTPGLTTGLVITVVAFILFVGYFVAANRMKDRFDADIEYPEGDEMLEEWQAAERHRIERHREEEQYKSILDGLADISEQTEKSQSTNMGGFTIDTDLFKDE